LNFITQVLISQVEITVFLKDGVKENVVYDIKKKLLSNNSVKEARFVSKEEALKRLEERLGHLPLKQNPLLNSIEVSVSVPEEISRVAQQAEKFKGVHHVKYGKKESEKLIKLSRIVHIIGALSIIFMTVVTLLIVSNTIRLTIYARRKEIEIMQLVGATRWFIRWPFLMEGMCYGFAGSLIAVIILSLTYNFFASWIQSSISFIPIIPNLSLFLSFLLILIGLIVGFIASSFSVSRFLKV